MPFVGIRGKKKHHQLKEEIEDILFIVAYLSHHPAHKQTLQRKPVPLQKQPLKKHTDFHQSSHPTTGLL